MRIRVAAAAVGAGITVFLVVAVAVIELVNVEFSALVGLSVGLLAGAVVAVVVAVRHDELAPAARYVVDAAAGFGLTVVALFAISYVNLAALRQALSTDVTVGVAVLVAVLTALASWRTTP